MRHSEYGDNNVVRLTNSGNRLRDGLMTRGSQIQTRRKKWGGRRYFLPLPLPFPLPLPLPFPLPLLFPLPLPLPFPLSFPLPWTALPRERSLGLTPAPLMMLPQPW